MNTNFKIFIAVIVTAALVGGGMYWYTQKPQNVEVNTNVLQSAVAPNVQIQLQGNPVEVTDDSCASGYLSGNVSLVLIDTLSKEVLDREDFEDVVISKNALHLVPKNGEYLVSLAEYGSCNGDVYSVYSFPELKKIERMNFVENDGSTNSEVFGNKQNGIAFAGSPESGSSFLAVDYYDNTEGKEKTATYNWDNKLTFTRSN